MKRAYPVLIAFYICAGALRADIVAVTPDNLNFGSQVLTTTSGVLSVLLSNQTKKDLNISGVAITGDFSVPSNSCSGVVGAGSTCTVNVTFAPTAVGLRTSLLLSLSKGGHSVLLSPRATHCRRPSH